MTVGLYNLNSYEKLPYEQTVELNKLMILHIKSFFLSLAVQKLFKVEVLFLLSRSVFCECAAHCISFGFICTSGESVLQ